MIRLKKFAAALMAMVLSMSAVPLFISETVSAAGTAVLINESNFPDEHIRSFISNYDYQKPYGSLDSQEIARITELPLAKTDITSIEGLEHLTSLKRIYVSESPSLTSAVFPALSTLTDIQFYDCENLSTLDVASCENLEILKVNYCNLSSFKPKNNPKLRILSLSGNNLSSIDVTGMEYLTELGISENKISMLQLTDCRILSSVNATDNPNLSRVYTRMGTLNNLTSMNLWNTPNLKSIDLAQFPNLRYINLHSTGITELDISNNEHLIDAYLLGTKDAYNYTYEYNYDTSDPSKKYSLLIAYGSTVVCPYVISVDPKYFPDDALREHVATLDDGDGRFTREELDSITSISLTNAGVSSASGINYFTNLVSLDLSGNDLTSFRVPNIKYLEELNLSDNPLTTLNVMVTNSSIRNLNVTGTDLGTLNLGYFTTLYDIISSEDCMTTTYSSGNVFYHTAGSDDNGIYCGSNLSFVKGNTPVTPGVGTSTPTPTDTPTVTPVPVQEGWVKANNQWFFYENGSAVTGWKKVDGKWYYLGTSGAMQTGWVQDAGKWYFMASDGSMQTGWKNIGGKWYCLGTDGSMKTGWIRDSGKWYYCNASGAMLTGWQKIGGQWYYLGTSGAMQTGWFQVDGKWYFCNASGAMQTGWVKSNSKWYFLYSDGSMATDTWIGNDYVDANGVWTASR